jgi:hypothetical protein
MTLDKQKLPRYNENTDAKLVWAKKILHDLTKQKFCGKVEINYHLGSINDIRKTEVLKIQV